ncbi:aminodeoxychorismate synthase component I [Marinoscillum sp. MHG1-6]|uniref:aminodeoxychorismate synthase component I n=1 Tax=Marinoscillum sp. MHG1-6 TaxID=2959627 RepID=UPI0021580AD3|nr:aminodeoxychorismate synthase component I [Marinoscillum sp. MHG1-6]
MILSRNDAISQINTLAPKKRPFFFFTDFLGTKAWIAPSDQIDPEKLSFDFDEADSKISTPAFDFSKKPADFITFKKSFDQVVRQINIGNSFLVNLTFKTPIFTDLSLKDIYRISRAKYKVLFEDRFVVFSPETFVKIIDGKIYSYPMKGTIDASLPNAKEKLLDDPKELAEHVTITDLIRNDLSQVAEQVNVNKFRFVTEVNTHEKKLLQVSSEIEGTLPEDYLQHLGTILFKLLPAGSISGAPKPKTVEIIQSAETYDRGYYTGVCGYFDGKNLNSGVMIRFIEKEDGNLYYKSGGGITSFSQADKEYQEFIDKVYVPIH